jgi:hypothetical protein
MTCLTAAHVIYREEFGGWVTQAQATAYDYGFITLDSSAGYITGWFNYGYVDEIVTFVGHEMVTLGYP